MLLSVTVPTSKKKSNCAPSGFNFSKFRIKICQALNRIYRFGCALYVYIHSERELLIQAKNFKIWTILLVALNCRFSNIYLNKRNDGSYNLQYLAAKKLVTTKPFLQNPSRKSNSPSRYKLSVTFGKKFINP